MKLGRVNLSIASLVLLVIQLGLVSSIAAKYWYERWTSPRVWTRGASFDSDLPMRGRYLSLQLTVDGCQSTLPSAKQAAFPHNVDGTVRSPRFAVLGAAPIQFQAKLAVQQNKLVALRLPEPGAARDGQLVSAWPGAACEEMHVTAPVSFYIGGRGQPAIGRGGELWVEVTVPRQGPPRPTQLAIEQNGVWKPLR